MTTAAERFRHVHALYRTGRLAEAEEAVAAALSVASKDPNFLHLAAQIAEARGNTGRAIMFYRRALESHPGWMEATFNMARVLGLQGHYAEALPLLVTLTEEHPKILPLWEALATFRERGGDLPAARDAWQKIITINPDHQEARARFFLLARQMCDWSVPLVGIDKLPPQAVTIFADDPALQRAAAERYAKQKGWSASESSVPKKGSARLRLGYLSSDFHAHATSYLMAELFELHDRERFEIFAYSYGVEDHSPIRARLRAKTDHFVELNNLTSVQAAARIGQDSLDVLIDLKGYTHGGRLDILAHRPAPVQMHWLGYPATLGAPFIDYFIGDSVTIPEGHEKFFSEKIIRLPFCYQVNDRQRAIGTPLSREPYGLPQTGFVFASFNQTYKITPEVFTLWCAALREIPDSVLWLYESNIYAPDNLRRVAAEKGVDPARLVFAKPAPLADHLARYAHVDLALDTFPVGGHTTTSDALWTGTPVISRIGKSFVARVAASVLGAANLASLVTENDTDYLFHVLTLARDPAALADLKKHLRENKTTLPLFDTPRFVRAFEKAVREVFLFVTAQPHP